MAVVASVGQAAGELVYKERFAPVGSDFEYVMSDASVDLFGDVVEASGWDLSHFAEGKNPIALFAHRSDFPIGIWERVRVEGGRLVGKLKLAEHGTSARIDEIISLVRQGVLKAVSVGFLPLEREPRKGGVRFTKQQLVECSLVSVPANANAMQIARSMHLSAATEALVFGRPAERDEGRVLRFTGMPAATPPAARKARKMSISEQIQMAEARYLGLKGNLESYLEGLANEPDDDQLTSTEDLTSKVDAAERQLKALKAAEAKLGASAEPATINAVVTTRVQPQQQVQRRPFALPVKKLAPADYIIRGIVAGLFARNYQAPIQEMLALKYGDDELTREVVNATIQRAATAPATTFTTNWAAELVATAYVDLLETLMPMSIYPRLSALGQRYTFGRNGRIQIPVRSATPTLAGSFVLEGNPIPVRQAGFTTVPLTPRKMGVITVMTREITEHSTPQIEAIVRQAIGEDTAVAIDTVLLDATAESTTRPAGLRNGVSATTATTGGGLAALVGDIKALVGVLTAANALRRPVWIMNPAQALSISLMQDASGGFPFRDGIAAGSLAGFPVLTSTTVTAAMVFLMDAADFASVSGDDPRFDVSDSAALHLDDTTPLAIGTAGSPATVAAPTRSLFQTDCLAIRMILPMHWAKLRTGTLAWISAVTW